MLPLLFLLTSAFYDRHLLAVTDRNYEKLIGSRPKSTPYLLMFYGDHCPACRSVYPTFVSAAKKLSGIAVLGHVDCSRNHGLASQFQIRSIPSYVMFHSQGITPWTNLFGFERTFISGVSGYIPDAVSPVNSSWKPGSSQKVKNGVILFTGQWSMPLIWKAVAANFSETPLLVGFVNDRSTKKSFKISGETVIGIKNEEIVKYAGEISFHRLQKWIADEFADVLLLERTEKREEKTSESGHSEL
jgi:thiol-disulfide isomerase/thioredoxin